MSFLPTNTNLGVSVAKVEVSGGSSRIQTEVHRNICTFFVFPLLQGCVSPQECRKMFKQMPGSVVLERPGRQS